MNIIKTQIMSTIRKCNTCGYQGIRMVDTQSSVIECKHCKIGRLEIIAIAK